MFDLLIKHGTLIDGSGSARRPADVALRGDRVVAIGQLDSAEARRVIDARGRIVAPGLIDVHNHSDGWLLKSAHQWPKTSQGFTSEILMSDGISYAPLRAVDAADWILYLRSLNGLRQEDYRGWESLADYLELLEGRSAQNAACLIPFANLRVLACGWGRAPADDTQINLMRREVRLALEAGAVGLSTGLDYISQCFASTEEIARVCEPLAETGRPYVTHIRYKQGLLRGLQEAVEIGRRAGVPVHISHLKPLRPEDVEPVLDYIDRVAVNEVDFSFDTYPYMAGSSLLCSLLPYEVWEDGPLAALGKLRDPRVRARFGELLATYHLALDRITLAWLPGRDNARYQGLSLAEYVEQIDKPLGDALCGLLIDEALAALAVFHVADDRLVETFLSHARQMVGSDGIYTDDGPIHPRVFGTATRMLGPLVRERRLFSLEEAIYKMSGYPAARFGFAQRGIVREGAAADLIVFDPDTVADRATYEEPRQASIGVEYVLVNGTPIIEQGEPVTTIESPPGRALRYRC